MSNSDSGPYHFKPNYDTITHGLARYPSVSQQPGFRSWHQPQKQGQRPASAAASNPDSGEPSCMDCVNNFVAAVMSVYDSHSKTEGGRRRRRHKTRRSNFKRNKKSTRKNKKY